MAEKDTHTGDPEDLSEEEDNRQPPQEGARPFLENDNEVLEEPILPFPLPGWTVSGHKVQQCSEPGGHHSPIGGIAYRPPSPNRNAQVPPVMYGEENIEVFPLPGWTEKGHKLQQCTEPDSSTREIACRPISQVPTSRDVQASPLPGWTDRGHKLQQCTESCRPNSPIGEVTPGREPQVA